MSALVYNFVIPTITKKTDTISNMKTSTHQVIKSKTHIAKNDIISTQTWGSLKLIHR
jgi:hypothetical protein